LLGAWTVASLVSIGTAHSTPPNVLVLYLMYLIVRVPLAVCLSCDVGPCLLVLTVVDRWLRGGAVQFDV
jgi:hypothetical protein